MAPIDHIRLPCIRRPSFFRGGGSSSEYCYNVGAEKLEWCGCPMVKKFEDVFIRSTKSTNVTDRQTHGQTTHDDIGRACIASCSKNAYLLMLRKVNK